MLKFSSESKLLGGGLRAPAQLLPPCLSIKLYKAIFQTLLIAWLPLGGPGVPAPGLAAGEPCQEAEQ